MIELDNAPLPSKVIVTPAQAKTLGLREDQWERAKTMPACPVRVYAADVGPALTLLVGGPLNGKRIDLSHTTARVVRVPYKRDPSSWVADSHEWYEVGDKPGNDARYHVGTDTLSSIELSERILSR